MRHPSVLAAYAGRNDGEFCKLLGSLGLGMVTIGGLSVDEATRKQSKLLVKRGRPEPIITDLRSYLETEIGIAKESGSLVAVNIRSATLKGYLDAAKIIGDMGAIIEVDAHCRQQEMMNVGAGQALLHDIKSLKKIIHSIRESVDAELILKFRGNIVSERIVANAVYGACDSLHVDAMQKGQDTADLEVFENIPDDMFLIGNNSVRDIASAQTILEFCDAFSFSRIADDIDAVKTLIDGI